MDAHFATFKDALMGLNDDEEPYACCLLEELTSVVREPGYFVLPE